jgi:hypothetical protein
MRSGSTLLAHILANNPEIAGAGEMHLRYQGESDLRNLVVETCQRLHKPVLTRRHIVDQINHDYIDNKVLLSQSVYKGIILIREPTGALKSTMKLFDWSETQAAEYYIDRMERLAEYGPCLAKRALLLEYNDLVENTKQTLGAVTTFLNLNMPLSSRYSVHRASHRSGDPSDNLRSGRIVRTPSHQFVLSPNIVSTATKAYRSCQEQLENTTHQLGDFIVSADSIAPQSA